MLEFSTITGLTKIFNRDDWKKVFHACAELPNYRDQKYSSYFVTNDAETRSGKLYYTKNELEKGGYSYDPASHTALTYEDDIAAGKAYEFDGYKMNSSVQTILQINAKDNEDVFQDGYSYSKALDVTASTFQYTKSTDPNACASSDVGYLTEQSLLTYDNKTKFLEGVRYAWDTGTGLVEATVSKTSTSWANHTYVVGAVIQDYFGKDKVIYGLPTRLKSKYTTTYPYIYRHTVGTSRYFPNGKTMYRKLPIYSYKASGDVSVDFIPTKDTTHRKDKLYYTRTGSGTAADPYVYTKIATSEGTVVGAGEYNPKEYFYLSTLYTLVPSTKYFSDSGTYYMYTGKGMVKATLGSEYTASSPVPENSFYTLGTSGTAQVYIKQEITADQIASGYSPTEHGLCERDERTGWLFCTPIGAVAPGTEVSAFSLYRNGNHLYYYDETITFYLIDDTAGTLSQVTYATKGSKIWNYQITTATDLYFKRSRAYYTDQDVSIDPLTGEYDLESNAKLLVAGTDYQVGQSIASWKSTHSNVPVYQHNTKFYLPTENFVGQVVHDADDTYYERAGTNFPYEGFVAVATETGSSQARGALYRCKRRTYELTEDAHHHYTGTYPNEQSKTYFEYDEDTGEYTARTPGEVEGDRVYRNYDGSSMNQITQDYVFQEGTKYFRHESCDAEYLLTAGTDYKVGDNIADWVTGALGRVTPYVMNRQFYYRNGWNFVAINEEDRFGITTDKRFQTGKEYYWYTGNGYDFSKVDKTDGVVNRAVVDDTIFGYHNEGNDMFWGYTMLTEGEDWTAGDSISDFITDNPALFPESSTKCLYISSGSNLDTSTPVTSGSFVAGTLYHYRNYSHITKAAASLTSVVTKLYKYDSASQHITEDTDGNPVPETIASTDMAKLIGSTVYTKYVLETPDVNPTYYYMSDPDNARWSKKFGILPIDDYGYHTISDDETTATQSSSPLNPYYYYVDAYGEYQVLVVSKGNDLDEALEEQDAERPIYIKTRTYTYIGRAINSQAKIVYIDPTEDVNVAYKNKGSMITEVPICVKYTADEETGCNTRGTASYADGEEIPTTPRIYLESKNGEEILPDEYYEEVYGSYYWDQFFLDHGISANPIEDVSAYYTSTALYMKWTDPTIFIPTNGDESLASDAPPDAWYRTIVQVYNEDGEDPITAYSETTSNEFKDEFLRLDMSSPSGAATTDAEKLYVRIINGGMVKITAISQTGTSTTYSIMPSKIVWTHSQKSYVSLSNSKALPNVTYYDYDTYVKDGTFEEVLGIYPYCTDVTMNAPGGVIARYSKDYPVYRDNTDEASDNISPVTVTDGMIGTRVPADEASSHTFTTYWPTPEVTWNELTQLGWFDIICSSGYQDVSSSGVTTHTKPEKNTRMKSCGSEITIPSYLNDTASLTARIIDTDTVIPVRDIELGYTVTSDTTYDSTKKYYTRKCESDTTCMMSASETGDSYDYEEWIPSTSNFDVLRTAGKLYEHDNSFPHYKYFWKSTTYYTATTDTTVKEGTTYYERSGGQVVGGETIETYLCPFTYTIVKPTTGANPYEEGWYVKGQDESYNTYTAVELRDPNWLVALKDPRKKTLYVKKISGSETYYSEVETKKYSATFRFKVPYISTYFADPDEDPYYGHLWGRNTTSGTDDSSYIRTILNDVKLGRTSVGSNWTKFFNEAITEVVNPVIVDNYRTVNIYTLTEDNIYMDAKTYYTPDITQASGYRTLVAGTDYLLGDQIAYTLSEDTEVDTSKTYFTYDEETGLYTKVTPEGTESPIDEGWYEKAPVYERTPYYEALQGEIVNNQTIDKMWIPSAAQLNLTTLVHPVDLEGVSQCVNVPHEGSPLYYYESKISGYGRIYNYLVSFNATGAAVPWWIRTALQNTVDGSTTLSLGVGPYISSRGKVIAANVDEWDEAYVYPCFTIA